MAEQRIDQPSRQRGDDQVGVEAHALGRRAGNDGGGRGTEHRLEQEEGQRPAVADGEVQHEQSGPDQSVFTGAEHQRKAEQPVQQQGDAQVGHVLGGDVDCVLATGQARFQAEKADLHVEYQTGTEHHPENIDRFFLHTRSVLGRKARSRHEAHRACWRIATSENHANR